MIRPDFNSFLKHSAKGSEWKVHEYIKKVDGNYYYPNDYTKGRTIDSLKKTTSNNTSSEETGTKITKTSGNRMDAPASSTKSAESNKETGTGIKEALTATSATKLSQDEVNQLASQVIRGDFGNGQIRKDLLGENYQEIQDKVNELMGVIKVDQLTFTGVPPKVEDKGNSALKEAITKVENITIASKGIDMEQVQSVYRKKK